MSRRRDTTTRKSSSYHFYHMASVHSIRRVAQQSPRASSTAIGMQERGQWTKVAVHMPELCQSSTIVFDSTTSIHSDGIDVMFVITIGGSSIVPCSVNHIQCDSAGSSSRKKKGLPRYHNASLFTMFDCDGMQLLSSVLAWWARNGRLQLIDLNLRRLLSSVGCSPRDPTRQPIFSCFPSPYF